MKFLKVVLSMMLVFSLTACGNKDKEDGSKTDGEKVSLKVWGAQEEQDFLKERIEAFKKENPDMNLEVELGVVGEPDARDQVLQDIDAAADIFAFANDQINDLVEAGALYEITKNKEKITEENVEGSVEAATVDGSLYAYPMTADNGYFLYYDSSVFSEEDVQSLDKMVEVAEKAGKKIYFDVANGWYLASFFLGAGNTIDIKDGKQVVDFNNEQGVKVGEYLRKFVSSDAFIGGDDSVLQSGLNDNIAAAVSGTWQADAVEDAYGENYAASKLPAINLDGENVQLASFGGYKLLGIKTSTKHPEEAMALAEFLSNEESQIKRFEARKLGPSNKVAAESDKVKENVALSALAKQNEFAQTQQNVLGSFWEPMEAFGTALIDGTTEDMKALLDKLVSQIEG